jgi:hypothetical protein
MDGLIECMLTRELQNLSFALLAAVCWITHHNNHGFCCGVAYACHLWLQTGSDAGPPPEFVREHAGKLLPNGDPEFDVVVAGGTLGIFLAAALQVVFYLVFRFRQQSAYLCI